MSFNPLASGSNSRGTSRATSTGFQNASGSTIGVGDPVYSNTSGQMIPLDVTSESSVKKLIGVCATSTANGANGQVVNAGRLENVVTSFAVGDAIYAGKSTALTNVRPSIGAAGFVAGDFVVFLGVLVKNEFNNSLTDIQLLIELVGEL